MADRSGSQPRPPRPPPSSTPSPSSPTHHVDGPLPPSTAVPAQLDSSPLFSPRSMKQLGMFFAGAGFMLVSTMVTKRAVTRKKLAAFPKFYQPSHAPAGKQENPEGSMIGLEALNLATLNVFSFGIMAVGGTAWAFDISSVDDLRARAQRTIYGEAGRADEAAEKEFEEWAARVLTRLGKSPTEGEARDQPGSDKKE